MLVMMKRLLLILCLCLSSCKGDAAVTTNYNVLNDEETRVIVHKGTEAPYSGEYNDFYESGAYHCKRCDAKLYESSDKFKSNCGWPSFDDEVPGAVQRYPDADGRRVEIVCANCDGHLGHVFEGEGFTQKNVRHCVNSVSLTFVPKIAEVKDATAYFAGGCFWGVEHLFQELPGVLDAESGYMGGSQENPSYQDVIHRNTGHYEVVKVSYDANKIGFKQLAMFFFEIHDPTQANGQGPDIGHQYQSVLFYHNEGEKQLAEQLIQELETKGFVIATQIKKVEPFWKAEDYHQDYYLKTKKQPYCHRYQKRF